MKTAGEGNPLFSKSGALNRFQHIIFLERNFESTRNQEIESIPEEYIGENEYLPKVLQRK